MTLMPPPVPEKLAIPQRGPRPRRHVFVCGLHRSGTTLIARYLAAHPMVSGFKDTGVIEDEGQFLQTVFPLEIEFGGVGRFGFDPRAHMTEDSPLNTPEAAAKLKAEWDRYWDPGKPVVVEKTPSNLLRMRLLQHFFDDSHFVIVTRHPVAASLATVKWTEGNVFSLLSHWVRCYTIARADAEHVGRTLWVSYESFIADPRRQLGRIADFLDLVPFSNGRLHRLRDRNDAYFDLWRTQYLGDTDRAIEQKAPERRRGLLTKVRDRMARIRRERSAPPHRRRENLRGYYDALDAVALLEPAVNDFGYSLVDLARFPRA